jgi:hypothetical protein
MPPVSTVRIVNSDGESVMKRSLAIKLVLVCTTLNGAALAKDRITPATPDAYAKVSACRGIAAPSERLACFDAAVATLDAAVAEKQVFMVDKQQVDRTRRTLFGLPLPNFNIFGGGGRDEPPADEITTLESTVKSVSGNANGVVVTIAEGSAWQQMDGMPLALSPKPGMSVTIKRGTLGSYKMSIRKQPAIKVKRIF